MTADAATEIERRLAQLGLEVKVNLLTGADHWSIRGAPEIGLRPMLMSDGPVGVRGELWDERRPSLNLPSATVLAATWDAGLAHKYGRVLAGEARRRGVHVLLAPTVNMHRSPLSGRHFEAYSEDPVLTGRLAAAVVRGIQRHQVAATVKHYVGNDYETERFTASTEVSDRALREVYLRPFEDAVVDGGAWLVMSGYNAVNGIPATESPLLTTPLRTDWGFDGVVVGDWGAVRSLRAATADQDLVMPGPHGPWGDALLAAIRDGKVPETVVDEKVRRLLLLAARVGALDGVTQAPPEPMGTAPGEARGEELAREVAVEGMVMLVNNDLLPLDPGRHGRIAVIGHNAELARTQGGGSATVVPNRIVSPLAGLRAALPDHSIEYSLGAVVQEGVAGLPLDELRHPRSGDPGVLVVFRDVEGRALHEEHRLATDLVWFGGDAPVLEAARLDVEFIWIPSRTGTVRLGFAAGASGEVEVDGKTVVSGVGAVVGDRLGASPLAPPSHSGDVPVETGVPRRVAVRLTLRREALGQAGLLAVRVGLEPDATSGQQLVEDAVALARRSDVAVVVVGTSSDVESEGFDRRDLKLPGHQDALVHAVAATGTPTVVVVGSGAPVMTPWRDDVDAVLVTHFGGQEVGHALADVLLGHREPGGRLPTTWPGEEAAPVLGVTPTDGRLEYSEGIHVGHRAWLRSGRRPAFSFGHGLGYTDWALSDAEMQAPTPECEGWVRVRARNIGPRAGKHVVQGYLARRGDDTGRPVRWLAAFQVVRARPGEEYVVVLPLTWRCLARWDDGWVVDPGTYDVLVGSSVTDLPLRCSLVVRED